ncbi:MAG: RHS repeat-associated core domain-containing protein, partial [Blastocatellia bacterium]
AESSIGLSGNRRNPSSRRERDSENHIVSVNPGSPNSITILYDGLGNRVSKTTNGVTTKYLIDDNNLTGYAQVVEELTNGSVSRTYAYGHMLISESQLTGSGPGASWATSFYALDGHGSVRFLMDSSGNVTDTYDYDAFGILIHQTGSTPNLYLYSAEQFDPDLGMYYLRARYMSSATGRFWTMDSFEGFGDDPLSLHKYTYCSGNPVTRADPSGHEDFNLQTTTVTTLVVATLQALAEVAADTLVVLGEAAIDVLEVVVYTYEEVGVVVITGIATVALIQAAVDTDVNAPEDGTFPTRLPVSDGEWLGEPGNSGWKSTKPDVNSVTGGQPVPFRSGFPDFSRWSQGEVKIANMTGDNAIDFAAADKKFAEQKGWLYRGQPNASASERDRVAKRLTWHHVEDGKTMMLVPRALHGGIPHIGGASIRRNDGGLQ